MTEIEKLYFKLGKILNQRSKALMKAPFHLKPKKMGYWQIKRFLETKIRVDFISLADDFWYVIPWETWKKIIKADWTEEKKYMSDRYDCDNFAYTFASKMAEIYDLNTAGVIYGEVNIGHYWNGIVALDERGELALYYYDAMREKYAKVEDSQIVKMSGWTYKPKWMRLF